MKVTLRLCNGTEYTFNKVENFSILEECSESDESKVIKIPTEGEWFEVNPLAIDRKLFKESRIDFNQDKTRLLILDAFEEMDKYPTYARPFKTGMPKKVWHDRLSIEKARELAEEFGYKNACWVEQALEWAQRIANGETWEAICNEVDTANWCRFVKWKNGEWWIVGGSLKKPMYESPSFATGNEVLVECFLSHAVPLVVTYK